MIIGYHEISMKHHRSTKIWNGSLCITKSWPSCAEPIRRSAFRISRRRALPRSSSSSSTKTSAQKKLGIILPYLPLDSDGKHIEFIGFMHQKKNAKKIREFGLVTLDYEWIRGGNELLQSRNSTPEFDLNRRFYDWSMKSREFFSGPKRAEVLSIYRIYSDSTVMAQNTSYKYL